MGLSVKSVKVDNALAWDSDVTVIRKVAEGNFDLFLEAVLEEESDAMVRHIEYSKGL